MSTGLTHRPRIGSRSLGYCSSVGPGDGPVSLRVSHGVLVVRPGMGSFAAADFGPGGVENLDHDHVRRDVAVEWSGEGSSGGLKLGVGGPFGWGHDSRPVIRPTL